MKPFPRTADRFSDDDGDQIVIQLPDPQILRLIARSVLLGAAVLFFTWFRITTLFSGGVAAASIAGGPKWVDHPFFLPMLLRDLSRQGLFNSGARAVFVGCPGSRAGFLVKNRVFPVSVCEMPAVGDRSVDFVLAAEGFGDSSFWFVDRVLKVGGVVTVRLSSDPRQSFRLPRNYRLAYIRRFGSTVVVIKKISHANVDAQQLLSVPGSGEFKGDVLLQPQAANGLMAIKKILHANADGFECDRQDRHLLSVPRLSKLEPPMENGIAAIKKVSTSNVDGLELNRQSRQLLSVPRSNKLEILRESEDDVLLEPPMADRKGRKRIMYLPQLMEDEFLDGFSRRVFVDIGDGGRVGNLEWFEKEYPKKGREFEVVRADLVDGGEKKVRGVVGWLERNLKEEEYVVMRAEAAVVEEMVKGKVIGLVDELFLECNNQWEKGRKKSKRPYWQCLTLYGKVRDQGVVVHQWWD